MLVSNTDISQTGACMVMYTIRLQCTIILLIWPVSCLIAAKWITVIGEKVDEAESGLR